jgi:hypothetical protein
VLEQAALDEGERRTLLIASCSGAAGALDLARPPLRPSPEHCLVVVRARGPSQARPLRRWWPGRPSKAPAPRPAIHVEQDSRSTPLAGPRGLHGDLVRSQLNQRLVLDDRIRRPS